MNNLQYSDRNQTELQNKGTTPEDKFKRSREVLKQILFHLHSSQTHKLVYFCSPVNSYLRGTVSVIIHNQKQTFQI